MKSHMLRHFSFYNEQIYNSKSPWENHQYHKTPILLELTQVAIFLMIGKWYVPDVCPS